jgi:hypothetical protein
MVLTGSFVLSPVIGLSCHRHRRKLVFASLTPASRRQDHTTSPSASGALVFCTISVHRIPTRVRDDRDTPLEWDETGGFLNRFASSENQNIFSKGARQPIQQTTRRANHFAVSGTNLTAAGPHRSRRPCCIGRAGCPSASQLQSVIYGVGTDSM